MTMKESVILIESAVDRLIARSDEIADSARPRGAQLCNLFAPREARKTAELCLAFIAAIAEASSMAAVVASAPALEALADHAKSANDAIASALPRNCRSNLPPCAITAVFDIIRKSSQEVGSRYGQVNPVAS